MFGFLKPKPLYCVEYKLNDSPIKYWYVNANDAVSAAKDIRRAHKHDKIDIVAAYPLYWQKDIIELMKWRKENSNE